MEENTNSILGAQNSMADYFNFDRKRIFQIENEADKIKVTHFSSAVKVFELNFIVAPFPNKVVCFVLWV